MKTMMKNSNLMTRVALTLLVMMLTATTAWADDSGLCGNGVTYYYIESTHTLTISGSGAMRNFIFGVPTDVPWYLYREEIKTVNIEDGVTSISDYAFEYCSSLESVSLPNSLTNIGDYAFYYCSSLKLVDIPDGVTSIGTRIFMFCSSLESVRIPDNVTSIGESAFNACSSLKSIEIPDGVTNIGIFAFGGCLSLMSVSLPNSLTSIGESTFHACSSLKSIEIPDGVTNIGENAFHECTALTSVSLPNSVTSIGKSAFYNCSGLSSITIPSSVKSIGTSAFDYCSGLKKVMVKDIAAWCNIYFDDEDSNPLKFAQHIYNYENTEITALTIPNSVTTICKYAFYNCSGLTSIAIPSSVTSIGSYAFGSCSGLTSVVIPSSVTSIGQGAFSACSSLKYVFVNAKTPPMIGDGVFFNNIDSRKIYVPSSSVNPYKKNWSNYANDIVDVSVLFSQDGDTYTIHNNLGWEVFCDALQDNDTYNRFTGKTVVLGADITVTRMAGSGGHEFCGTFDGDGHTLTVQYGSPNAPIEQQQFVAPFVETARNTSPVFRNLTIDGNIYVKYADSSVDPGVGGLIGHLFGNVKVEHCVSNVVINSDKDRVGGFVGLCEYAVTFTDCKSSASVSSSIGNISGFVGWSRASTFTIAFEGCLFNGKLLQLNGTGGSGGCFVGWKGDAKTVNINNCLVAPATLAEGESMASSGSATFCRQHNDKLPAEIKNSYYTTAFGAAQGTQPRSIVAGENVAINHIQPTGSDTNYTTSGITAYSGGGIKYDGKFYYGKDDVVSLTLSHEDQEGSVFLGYEAKDSQQNAVTLTPADDNYTLTMPDDNVTVTAKVAMLYSLTLPDRMEVVSATPAAIDGKYQEGTTIQFKLNSDYVLDGDVKNGDTVLTAVEGIYTVTVGNADITITATVKKAVEPNVILTGGDYTAQNGDVLTGSTDGTVRIADGASITLSDVTINGGIVCEGTATITLVGENSVTGLKNKAGIQVGGSGTTLTIKGNGALTANGGYLGAGIGTGEVFSDGSVTLGNITIEGGSITATGGYLGAGIGTGDVYNGTATLSNITIEGGRITANGGYYAAGIGTGEVDGGIVRLGNITIKGGSITAKGGDYGAGIGTGCVDLVGSVTLDNITIKGGSITANGGKYGAGIGTGFVNNGTAKLGTLTIYDDIDLVDATGNNKSGISKDVVYMHGESNVTGSASDYFNIIHEEEDNHDVIESKKHAITLVNDGKHGTVTVVAKEMSGESVAITVTPDNGYMLDTIEVKDANGNEVSHNDMSFIMPDSNVTITVTWKYVGVKGDVNGDGTVDISDVVALVNIILSDGTDENSSADVNNDEGIDISDVVALVNIILGQ